MLQEKQYKSNFFFSVSLKDVQSHLEEEKIIFKTQLWKIMFY